MGAITPPKKTQLILPLMNPTASKDSLQIPPALLPFVFALADTNYLNSS